MKSSESSAEQKYYTSVNWISKEKQQVRTKVQGHSSIAKVKMAHQISMHHKSKSIASTQMDADLRKIGTKISGLRDKKARTEHMTLGEIISNQRWLFKLKPRQGPKSRKTSLLHVPRERH
jgi:hypothetical protein